MDFVLEPDELDRMDTLTSLCVTDCTDLRLFLDTARIFEWTRARAPFTRMHENQCAVWLAGTAGLALWAGSSL